MFELVVELFQIVSMALIAYDETEEGHAAITALLTRLEDEGIDVPFFEPTGEPIEVGSDVSNMDIVKAMAERFAARHKDERSGGA